MLAWFFWCIFLFACVCSSVCSSSCSSFSHLCFCLHASPSRHSYTELGREEWESQDTSCWIHTVWKARRERAGLMLTSTWQLWHQLWYQPFFLIVTYCGKANPSYQDTDKELSSLCAWRSYDTKARRGLSWSLKMWTMWVSFRSNNHMEQIETP